MTILSKVWNWLSKLRAPSRVTQMDRAAEAEELIIVTMKTSDDYEEARERLAFLREQADSEVEKMMFDEAFQKLRETQSGHLYREGIKHKCGRSSCPEYEPRRPSLEDDGR